MAKLRFSYSDDFILKDGNIGVNTEDPKANLDVRGIIKADNLTVNNSAIFSAYEGFLKLNHQIENNVELNFDQGINASLSGEIIVGTGHTVTINEVIKETAGVGNQGNTRWVNLISNYGSGVISGANWTGKEFNFDGSNDKVDLLNPLAASPTTPLSFEGWAKSDTLGSWQTVMGINGSSTQIAFASDNTIRFGRNGGAGNINADSGFIVVANAWYHIVGTYDGNASNLVNIYVNGSLEGSNVDMGSNGGNNGSVLRVGSYGFNSSGGEFFNGQISLVRIYSRPLTASEVSINYNLGAYSKETPVTDGLVLHLNANNPSSYPGTLSDVDTTDVTRAGGSQIDTLKVFNTFTPPNGGTNERPYAPKPGELYYNYDFKTIEFFDGNGWRQVDNTTRSGRGVLGGGRTPSDSAIIDYIQIMTTGNALDFGDLTVARTDPSCFSSEVRGMWAGGGDPTSSVHIDYVSTASAGNAIDFGDTATSCRGSGAACSSSTRGVYAQGINANVLQYVEIDTKGNGLDFGDLSANLNEGTGFGSPTRGIFLRGNGSFGFDAITIASKGNGIDFGEDCVSVQGGRVHTRGASGCSNSIRGVVAGGGDGASAQAQTSKIRYLTISTGGTAVVFGDLTFETRLPGALANSTRGVFSGGLNDPSNIKTINYVTIASTGNAQDFGNLTVALHAHNGCSDSHGGLGGF